MYRVVYIVISEVFVRRLPALSLPLLVACAPDTGSIDLDAEASPTEPITYDASELDLEQSVLANLQSSDSFTILVEALTRTDLVDALRPENIPGQMGWTLFAPTDEAFAASGVALEDFQTDEDLDVLSDVLLYHVTFAGPFGLDLDNGNESGCTPYDAPLAMANGEYAIDGDYTSWTSFLDVANDCEGTVTANEATVISLDHRADDGMLQVVDAVLLP